MSRFFEGFTGLPSAWRMVLKASGITKEEAVEHPQAVLDALAFHMDGAHPAAQQMRPKMPSKEAIAKTVTEVRCAVLCDMCCRFCAHRDVLRVWCLLTHLPACLPGLVAGWLAGWLAVYACVISSTPSSSCRSSSVLLSRVRRAILLFPLLLLSATVRGLCVCGTCPPACLPACRRLRYLLQFRE